MTYSQLTSEERYMLAALRRQGCNQSQIARLLGRHRSTVCREVKRNGTRADGHRRASTAQERANGRRSRSRRNQRFSADIFSNTTNSTTSSNKTTELRGGDGVQCFRSFHTAERALEGVEALHGMRKGEVKRLGGRDSIGLARFVGSLFGVAA
jgi:predicted transcriptional regulator